MTSAHDLGDPHYLDTPIWKAIIANLDSFRSVTKVLLGNGASTSFWFDLWLGDYTLSERFPALLSHSIRPLASVSFTFLGGIRANLGPRLTPAALAQLRTLTSELASVEIRPAEVDSRVGRLTNKLLSNKDFYSFTFRHLQTDELATMVWRSDAPLKCKIFCWLAKRRRLPTNERRFRHLLASSAACPSCPLNEDVDHLLLACPRAREVWEAFSPDNAALLPSSFNDLLLLYCQRREDSTINTAIAWNIWKRRNTLVFNGIDEPASVTTQRCIQDVRLWAHRCSNVTSRSLLTNWCIQFDPP
jgi:mannosylglycoprotein endo-beta-mannosidase